MDQQSSIPDEQPPQSSTSTEQQSQPNKSNEQQSQPTVNRKKRSILPLNLDDYEKRRSARSVSLVRIILFELIYLLDYSYGIR